ncbi:MAG: hypothetical protein Q7W51_01760 [Coriobacteriia bacterium]|nr:hypothetical protein [Coriobacteriia bacterium]
MNNAEIAGAALMVVRSLGTSLAITLVVELAVVAAWFGMRAPRELAVLGLINVATNPTVNLLLAAEMAASGSRSLADPVTAATLAVLEVAVVLVEWQVLARLLPEWRGSALRMSVVMNVASFGVGMLVVWLR